MRVLGRPTGPGGQRLDATGGVDTDGRDGQQRIGHVARVQATRDDDRDPRRDERPRRPRRHACRCRRARTRPPCRAGWSTGWAWRDRPRRGATTVRGDRGRHRALPSPAGGRWSALMTGSGMTSSASGGSRRGAGPRPGRVACSDGRDLGGVPIGEDAHQLRARRPVRWSAAPGGPAPRPPARSVPAWCRAPCSGRWRPHPRRWPRSGRVARSRHRS